MTVKFMYLKDLHETIFRRKETLLENLYVITYIRSLDSKGTLEVEVFQKRNFKNSVPEGYDIFPLNSNSSVLLFNRLIFFKALDITQVFPEIDSNLKCLNDIANTFLGGESNNPIVYPELSIISKIHLPSYSKEKLTPIITILELTESQLRNFEHIFGIEPVSEIYHEINSEKNVLKIGEEYIVEGTTGEKIFRFTRTQFVEDNPEDIFIKNKLPECEYNLMRKRKLEEELKYNSGDKIYLFFDTETTGLPINYYAPVSDTKNWPRLVQLAYILCDQVGNKIDHGNFIIKPNGFEIPEKATEVHKISNQRAIMEGLPLSVVLEKFQELVEKSHFLVAHNMAFDKNILGSEYFRIGINNPLLFKEKICTMENSTKFCAIKNIWGYKSPTLFDLHLKLFGDKFDEAHNAAVDVEITTKCFWELRKRGEILQSLLSKSK